MSNDVTTDPDLDDFLGAKPQKPWRKWAIRGAIALALLILILLIARCFGGEDKPNYATREARRGDLTVTVSATGNLKPINQVDVGSEQSGKITQVYVDVNDRVTRGQKLAELDTRRLVDTVNQNQAQVASSQASVAQAQAQVALAKATLAGSLSSSSLTTQFASMLATSLSEKSSARTPSSTSAATRASLPRPCLGKGDLGWD